MYCEKLTLLTSAASKVKRGRCRFYNQVVDAGNCQKKDGSHVKCFKFELPIKRNE